MKIEHALVFGDGLLGSHVAAELKRRGVHYHVIGHANWPIEVPFHSFEQTGEALEVFRRLIGDPTAECPPDDSAENEPITIFNCAGLADVGKAAANPKDAYAINAFGAENLALAVATARAGGTIVHASTEFVFDGNGPGTYSEFDVPQPVSVYAKSKRAGELLVERATSRHHIVRMQGLYGRGGNNLLSLLHKKRPSKLDDERLIQPTWATHATRVLCDIAESERFGIWHVSSPSPTTFHEFCSRLTTRLGIAQDWEPAPAAHFDLRPKKCLLEHRRLEMCGLPGLPTWEAGLDEYLGVKRDS